MMKKYLPLIIIFSIEIFFSLSALFGYEYSGKEASSIYIVYNITLLIVGISYFSYATIVKKMTFNARQLMILLFPLIIVFIFLCSILFFDINETAKFRFLYFILWSVPSLYMGIYLSKNNRIDNISRFMEILMLIFTFATIITTYTSFRSGIRVGIGGATYQNASYIAAFAFGINLYYIFYGNNHDRIEFCRFRLYKIMCFVFLFVQITAVLASGGRGGAVLIFIYLVFMFISLINKHEKLLKYFLFFVGIGIGVGLLLPNLMNIPVFKVSFDRAFSYLSNGGINWAGTSNRNFIYEESISLILDSPLVGYGLFGMWNVSTLPHNIFLEVLLQGGLIYFMFFILFMIIIIKKLLKLIKLNPKNRVIIIIALYPFIMLIFSGSYISNAQFWFVLSFILGSNFEAKNKNMKCLKI